MTDLLKDITGTEENGDADAMKGRFLTFRIGEETYGIALVNVMEIIGMQPITQMPDMPDYIRGIINLRGRIVPAMDVRLRFRKPDKDYNDRTCVIVICVDGISIGLIVDSVSDVLSISNEEIVDRPEISSRGGRCYVRSIGKIGEHVILLIDCGKLLNAEELEVVSAQLP